MVVRNPILKPAEAGPVYHRFTLEEVRRMIAAGILNGNHRCELIEGYLVEQPIVNPPHAQATRNLLKRLDKLVSDDWVKILGQPIELPMSDAMYLPDIAYADGPDSSYDHRHPTASEVAFVVEVSETSLNTDQSVKLQSYARDKVPVYWIVNLIDRRVEVYTQPRGGKKPTYRSRTDFGTGTAVPVVLRGTEVGSIPIDTILPSSEES